MMRRYGGLAVLAGLAGVLSGCMYDPYTGGFYPCCAYPYGPYASPYYGGPGYGYPAQGGYQAQPGYPPPQDYQQGPPR